VAVLDWRGQGGSGRLMRNSLKGHVKSFNDYEDDVARFMNEVALPDCPPPYYALAHSMGGTVLLKAATMRGCWFSRMVLTAPMIHYGFNEHNMGFPGTITIHEYVFIDFCYDVAHSFVLERAIEQQQGQR